MHMQSNNAEAKLNERLTYGGEEKKISKEEDIEEEIRRLRRRKRHRTHKKKARSFSFSPPASFPRLPSPSSFISKVAGHACRWGQAAGRHVVLEGYSSRHSGAASRKAQRKRRF